MNELDLKQKRYEMLGKVLGLGVAGFFFAPVAYATISGVISLVVVLALALFAVNVVVPWFAVSLANWKLKALKAAAAANPIETLENQYALKEAALIKSRDMLKEFYVVIQELWGQIQDHNQRYPDRPSQFVEKYDKMKALLELRTKKYKLAQKNLQSFAQMIDEKRSDWKVAQSAAKAMKLANVGEDFQSKLMSDTAVTTIQDGLNLAFSELEVSLADEQPTPEIVTTVSVGPKETVKVPQLTAKTGPPTLDLDFEAKEAVFVSSKRK